MSTYVYIYTPPLDYSTAKGHPSHPRVILIIFFASGLASASNSLRECRAEELCKLIREAAIPCIWKRQNTHMHLQLKASPHRLRTVWALFSLILSCLAWWFHLASLSLGCNYRQSLAKLAREGPLEVQRFPPNQKRNCFDAEGQPNQQHS